MKPNYHDSNLDGLLRVPPTKLINCSLLFVSFGILVLFGIGMLVSIPEVSNGVVRLYNQQSFVNIYAKSDSRVAEFFITDGTVVQEGDVLAILDNPIAYKDYKILVKSVLKLDSLIKQHDTIGIAKVILPELTKTGRLLCPSQEVQKQMQKLSDHIWSGEYTENNTALLEMKRLLADFNKNFNEKANLLELSVAAKNLNLKRNQHLHDSELIADSELEQIEAAVLTEKLKLESLKADILQNRIKLQEVNNQLISLKRQYINERNEIFLCVVSAQRQLQELIQGWEDEFLIKATENGQVQLTNTFEKQQFMKADDVILTLLPPGHEDVRARMQCRVEEAQKVKLGNEALIELQGFPAITHGYIRGSVRQVSEVPVDGMYTVDIVLKPSLVTTLGLTLQINRYAEGRGKIITGKDAFLLHLLKKILPGM